MEKHVYNKKFKSFFDSDIDVIEFQKKKKGKGEALTILEFIRKAKSVHGNMFDYSECKYVNMSTKINIICKKHNVKFNQTPINHIYGPISCPICNKNVRPIIIREIFIKQANKKHGNKFDYSLVRYDNENDLIKIICPKHGVFEQNLRKHLRGDNCPKCILEINKNMTISVGETLIEKWLNQGLIVYEKQKTFEGCRNKKLLRFDFYLPNQNMLIEYDGKQHFEVIKNFGGESGFVCRKQNDKLKTEYARDNDIELLRIPYTEMKNVSTILKTIL